MGERRRLTEDEVRSRIEEFPRWSFANGKLHREFRFDGFAEAFGFMASLALVAERMDHHPDWSNVYNRVVVDLSTHDVGGVSERDFELAEAADRLFG